MDKIKHIPLFLFAVASLKLLILGADWPMAAVLLVLGGIAAFWEYKSQEKKFKDLEEILKKQNEVQIAQARVLDELRSNMSAVKIASGMRPTSGGRV